MTTVFVSGIFNVLHPGHLRLLRFAKESGSRVLVAVLSDRLAGNAVHVPEMLRLEGVKSNSWVDDAFVVDEPVIQVIGCLQPDIVVKGKEHEDRHNPETDIVSSYGGQLIFSSGESLFSSLELLQKEFHEASLRTINSPEDYLARHAIDRKRVETILKQFASLRVLVIGDMIVDEYITCEPLGMSQEDPTIVVTPVDTTQFIGGAGIVAAHASGLGAEASFISVIGRDSAGKYAEDALVKAGVNVLLVKDESRPTTLKQRFRSKGKSLLRVSHLHQTAIGAVLQHDILEFFEEKIREIDLLVFSDFNYGVLPQKVVDQLIRLGKLHHVMMVADSQSSSQLGDVSRFYGMDLITPTEREARISTRNHEDGLVVMAEELRQLSEATNILLKLGGEGVLIHADNDEVDGWLTDRVCALNSVSRDVAGAGDSLLIASAMPLAVDGSIWEAAYIGSLAAAIQVGRVGNTPIKSEELLQELHL
ncbi:MAG: adenylyltransferase/cytidyltransferase family protein [Gammaproteobacteria bacterium]|nr:adenylyltransferase/cytidyltransferase family protein [Gammaproteobacteria bacterium]